ncbi:MAG: cation diffusion facilitator family transporter [Flavobacteriales bacterium]|nr:cation diffusion facilitator family transporter [Flavobacteriales bacterium]
MIQDTPEREKQIYKVTLVGSAVNFLLVIAKFMAGILGNSAAMIADAVHSLSDFATDVIVIFFVKISGRPKDKDHDYGHGKYETLATAIIGIVLFCVGVGIMWEGITKIVDFYRGVPLEAPGMLALWAALVSIVAKELLYQYTVLVGKKINSPVVVANAWHHRSDAFSSIGTAVGIGGAILLGEKWRVLDPVAAVVVSVFIMKVAVQMLVPCVEELLEKSLPDEVERQILDTVNSFPEVADPHNLRTRRIGSYYAIEVHIRMSGDTPLSQAHDVATRIENRLIEMFGAKTHVAIHLEPEK